MADNDNYQFIIFIVHVNCNNVFTFLFPFIAFEQWKAKVEEEERCSFIKTTGMKDHVQYYQCNRGGVYKPKGTGKRHLKSQGTIHAIIKYELLLLPLVPQPTICIMQACREGGVQWVPLYLSGVVEVCPYWKKKRNSSACTPITYLQYRPLG